jgi:uncharacterized protein (DUF427 family)
MTRAPARREREIMKAVWNGTVIAESQDTVVVEGNHYFPIASVNRQYLRPSTTTTVCSWKGTANYYDLVVGDRVNRDAVWYYDKPSPAAKQIEGRCAFWHGVQVAE